MATMMTSNRPVLAVMLKICAIFMFILMAAIIKATSGRLPPGEVVFFRSFFSFPVILIWLISRGNLRQGLVTRQPMRHFWRGVLGTFAMAMTFAGLGLLPLPEVTAIGYATPIFTVILAAFMLNERIRLVRISAVAIGLVGVLIMLWPRLFGGLDLETSATLGAMLILGATVGRSFVQIHVRKMVRTEHTAAIVFYFSLTATTLSLLTLPFGWVVPDAQTAMLLVMTGLLGGVGQIMITSALRFGAASMLAPIDYSSMLFAIVIGYVWFDELPTVVMLAGASLVVAGNILVIWREHQLGLERGKAQSLSDPKV